MIYVQCVLRLRHNNSPKVVLPSIDLLIKLCFINKFRMVDYNSSTMNATIEMSSDNFKKIFGHNPIKDSNYNVPSKLESFVDEVKVVEIGTKVVES